MRVGLTNRQAISDRLTSFITPAQRAVKRFAFATRSFYEIVFDNAPTAISNLRIASLSPTSAVVEWNTNHLTRLTKVNYGPDTSYGQSVISTELSDFHSVTLTDLTPNTTYYFEVMNQNGDYVFDAYYTLTTLPEDSPSRDTVFVPQIAIVTIEMPVYTSNDPESEILTTIHPGEEYRALVEEGAFVSILLPTGAQGWIEKSLVEFRDQVESTGVNREGY